MAKRVKKALKKRAVKKGAELTAATEQPTLLGSIKSAIEHKHARPILGQFSEDDLDILARHMSAGTLMPALTHIADNKSKDAAVSAMPKDVGNVINKLSDTDVAKLRVSLRRLPVNARGARSCPC